MFRGQRLEVGGTEKAYPPHPDPLPPGERVKRLAVNGKRIVDHPGILEGTIIIVIFQVNSYEYC